MRHVQQFGVVGCSLNGPVPMRIAPKGQKSDRRPDSEPPITDSQ